MHPDTRRSATLSVVEDLSSSTPRPVLYPTTRTILKALVVARWLSLAWMVGIVAFSADELRHPVVAWLAVGATLALTTFSTVTIRADPARLLGAAFVLAEVGLAAGLSMIDGYVFYPGHVFATTQSIATQWPLLAMATVGVAFGPVIAGISGLAIGPAEMVGAVLNDFDEWATRHVVSIVATSLFFGACGVVFGWLSRLLRRAEGEIADRRARDEVGRVLHDTVLQTLALVEQRTAASDPELASAAREADHDLRAFLFGSASRGVVDLETRIRQSVERVRRGHDVAVTVNVIDDGCRLPDDRQDMLARAIGEGVANALQHAAPTRVVVFAETDDRGEVFASVHDDGSGFDLDERRDSHGIDQSIIGRIESIGGRVEIRTAPGAGTDVNIWTRGEREDQNR